MKTRPILSIVSLSLIGLAPCQSLDNTFDVALGTAGLNIREARFDPSIANFFQDRLFESPFYLRAYENPWRVPFLMATHRDQLASAADTPADALAVGSRMLGRGSRRTLLGNPTEAAERFAVRPGSLNATLQRYQREGLLRGPLPNVNAVPEPARQAAALILTVIADNAPMRRASFAAVPDIAGLFVRARQPEGAAYDPEAVARNLRDARAADLNFLFAASQDISSAVTVARNRLLGIDRTEQFRLAFGTVWGEVIISGGSNDRYTSESPALLIIDTSGDDTYVGFPANRSVANWFSGVIDVRGSDKYISHPRLESAPVRTFAERKSAPGFGPGSATLGICMLLDLQGDDLYRSHLPGIASAQFGVAWLGDGGGNDTYDSYAHTQGAATFGMAALEDMAGNDSYTCFTTSQGFGGTAGWGALIDRLGNDTYSANTTDLDFPSPQDPRANSSMAQGVGMGRRADYLDGHSQSGGIGILYDLAGDDRYTCGVFGQGAGYWDGVGILWDRSGNDQYAGVWYVQGASAHSAIGYLEDEDGKDSYTATTSMSHGAGHDFGLGMLLDRGGDDTYAAANLSLGASSANGIGVCLDFSGADTYSGQNITLGRAMEVNRASLREKGLGLGLFYDGAGLDRYPTATNWAKDAVRLVNWTDRGTRPEESQLGIFWDR